MCSDLRLCSYLDTPFRFLYFSLPCPYVFAIDLPAGVLGSAQRAALVVSPTSHFVYSKDSTDRSGSLTADLLRSLNSGCNDHTFGVILAEGLKSIQYEWFKAFQVNFLLSG